ncbi:peptide deformylase [Photobacterium satsumensis]|uniref:peptide deformylase n=1 Tax=Photobacterium satsumensis TaxID=2910239 RepID=UPI003D12914E
MNLKLLSILIVLFSGLLIGCALSEDKEVGFSIKNNVFVGDALRKNAEHVDPVSNEARLIANKLIESANSGKNAVGLAAPQIGIGKSVFVYRVPERKDGAVIFPDEWEVAVNASYEPASDEIAMMPEGCFSVPHFYSRKVPRYKKIHFSYFTLDGTKVESVEEGYKAQIIQHETDHLNGVLYIDKLDDTGSLGKLSELKKSTSK